MTEGRAVVHHSQEAEEYDTSERCQILETWNRDSDPALSLARARVGPGITTRRHRLNGITERYLILEGRGLVEVEGLSPEIVTPGDLVFIPPEHHQRITNIGEGDLIFVAACTPRFVATAYEDLGGD
jgi:mannose-6-phosphate isomerase-like protein (cupin superfamily)